MIKNFYRISFDTIHAARYCIIGVFFIYFGATVLGWLYSESFPFIEEQVKALTKSFADKSATVFILKIFIRNLVASYIVTCALSLWGLLPVFAAALNGLLLGWVMSVAGGESFSKLAVLLIPHGLFEWPAMFIGWGTGIWKGVGYRFGSGVMTYRQRFGKANIVYFTFVFPLLVVAAVIEGRYHLIKEVFG